MAQLLDEVGLAGEAFVFVSAMSPDPAGGHHRLRLARLAAAAGKYDEVLLRVGPDVSALTDPAAMLEAAEYLIEVGAFAERGSGSVWRQWRIRRTSAPSRDSRSCGSGPATIPPPIASPGRPSRWRRRTRWPCARGGSVSCGQVGPGCRGLAGARRRGGPSGSPIAGVAGPRAIDLRSSRRRCAGSRTGFAAGRRNKAAIELARARHLLTRPPRPRSGWRA